MLCYAVCVQECLEAAGEWETLMAVCVCCGDFGALRSMAAGLKVGGLSVGGAGGWGMFVSIFSEWVWQW